MYDIGYTNCYCFPFNRDFQLIGSPSQGGFTVNMIICKWIMFYYKLSNLRNELTLNFYEYTNIIFYYIIIVMNYKLYT